MTSDASPSFQNDPEKIIIVEDLKSLEAMCTYLGWQTAAFCIAMAWDSIINSHTKH